MNSFNVASHLPRLAAQQPTTLAVVCPAGRDSWDRPAYTQYNFRELDRTSNHFAHQLDSIGIRRGVRTVLMTPPSLEFFALTFALFKIGAVPVLVDPGMGVRNLGKCLAEAAPEAFIGIPKAHLARRILGWARSTIRIMVAVGRTSLGSTIRLNKLPDGLFTDSTVHREYPVADVKADEMAAILFTSGSTGVAKGAVYTHGMFSSQVEAIRQAFDIRPGEIDLATFPLFALFGPALGMTAIVPEMDPTRPARVVPGNITDSVGHFGVTNLFGSPALLNRVARGTNEGVRLDSLKRVISAGAPVSASVIEQFVRLLPPGVQVFTPYGATESLPVAVIGSDEILRETRHETDKGKGVCVGRPVAGIDVKIIKISDDPIPNWSEGLIVPTGEIGEIAVRAPWASPSYFNRPEATALAKIKTPDGFYHRMGDVGYFDDRGRLWFCGRKSHRVMTKDRTLFTIPCEGVFNTHPAVFRTALIGVRRGDDIQPILCVEREPDRSISEDSLRSELLEIGSRFEHTKMIRTLLFHPAFPVDIRHNAKIFREKLAVWADKRV
jgi:acyl-CoA synthetase (AMP-forming)/AMP-acid ligase II